MHATKETTSGHHHGMPMPISERGPGPASALDIQLDSVTRFERVKRRRQTQQMIAVGARIGMRSLALVCGELIRLKEGRARVLARAWARPRIMAMVISRVFQLEQSDQGVSQVRQHDN